MNNLSKNVVLSARGLTKRFTEGRLDVTVLQGVDLTVRAGDTLAMGRLRFAALASLVLWLATTLAGTVVPNAL